MLCSDCSTAMRRHCANLDCTWLEHICGQPGAGSIDHVILIAAGGTEAPATYGVHVHPTRYERGIEIGRGRPGRAGRAA